MRAADPDLGRQELSPQVQPRGLGQRRRVVGQGRVDVAHLAQEDLPDLGSVAVNGGDQDVRGTVLAELDDQLRQVGLVGGDALGRERVVQPDLVGGQRLDLDDLGSAGRRREAGHDRIGLRSVPGPVHGAAGSVTRASSCSR